MRVFIEIIRFELRQQFMSLFVWASLLLSFLLHLLATGSIGITLWAHPQAYINSTYAVAVVNSTLTLFNLLPIIVFVTNAVLRDYERNLIGLFFVKPITERQYFGGRFVAVSFLSLSLGVSGILGSLLGTLMPWVEPSRLASFTLQPYLFCFFTIVLPNLLVLSAIFFSIATIARSLAAVVGLAGILIALDVLLASVKLNVDGSFGLIALADYSTVLVIESASRNLSIAELNTLNPTIFLLENRLLWFGLSFGALFYSFKRFSFKVEEGQMKRWRWRFKGKLSQLGLQLHQKPLTPLASQFRIDLSTIVFNPLFLLIVVLVIGSTVVDYKDHVSPIMKSPLYALTSARLDFFRYGLLHLVLLFAVYFSAVLVHRERASGIAELVGASAVKNWVMPVSKTLALCASVTLLLAMTMLTAMARQNLEGNAKLEIGLYLRTVFLHNGFYYWMICILAVWIQTMVTNKWLGMLIVLSINIFFLTLQAFGFEHVLYRYALPTAVYSDMNGFGSPGLQIYNLICYWGFFCALLIMVSYLFYPRGTDLRFGKRLTEAAKRIKPITLVLASLFFIGFVSTGCWIFYNTNVLHHYQTSGELRQAQADYERIYGKYEDYLTPSLSNIDIAFDIFPEQQRIESRGNATLSNSKKNAINEFVISVDPRLNVHHLSIDEATLLKADTEMGFYLFKPNRALLPDSSLTLHWSLSRQNIGFANGDEELLENGTFINGYAAMPMPGFDDTRKLTDNTIRKEFGLPEAVGLPRLGNRAYLDRIAYGIDSRASYHVVVSTSESQIAIAPGKLKQQWRKNGRRYFEYTSERPAWPKLYFLSARYKVAKQTWSDAKQKVALEIYFEPKHFFNVNAMMETIKQSLTYLTNEFGPYPYSYYKVMEYPRYSNAAKALPGGTVAYSEGVGWLADWSNLGGMDYTTIHELAHKWWGEQAYGAKMQGREVLNETLAQYSTLMIFKKFDKEHKGPDIVNRLLVDLQNNYLQARNRDTKPEKPLMYTDAQGYVSYNKGALGLYRLHELIGEKEVNRALKNYLEKFAFRPAPFPTAKDLVSELRAVAGTKCNALITELFEKVVVFDLELTKASITKKNENYEVSLTVDAKQFEADKTGREIQTPMQAWLDVGLFLNAEKNLENQIPSYLRRHLIKSGVNTITIKLKQKPTYASIDPFRKFADKEPMNNGQTIENMR